MFLSRKYALEDVRIISAVTAIGTTTALIPALSNHGL
jgi:hypothetical protein